VEEKFPNGVEGVPEAEFEEMLDSATAGVFREYGETTMAAAFERDPRAFEDALPPLSKQ
jgi:hypothetical protein